jgi:hypothetical protein
MQPPASPGRQAMQIVLAFVLPAAWIGSLMKLLALDHPLAWFALGLPVLAATLALAFGLWLAARKAAAASTRRVPRLVYGLAGLCFLALAGALAPLSYAQSHASGDAYFSVTLGFLAGYCAIAGVLGLGRAVVLGPRRLAFWVFLPRWLQDAERTHA